MEELTLGKELWGSMGDFITVLTWVIGRIDSKMHAKSLLHFLFSSVAETIRHGI